MGKESATLPTRYVAVGETFERYGARLICVARPRAGVLVPSEACRGCWFAHHFRAFDNSVTTCRDIQCSRFDRMDGRNVWFKEVFGDE